MLLTPDRIWFSYDGKTFDYAEEVDVPKGLDPKEVAKNTAEAASHLGGPTPQVSIRKNVVRCQVVFKPKDKYLAFAGLAGELLTCIYEHKPEIVATVVKVVSLMLRMGRGDVNAAKNVRQMLDDTKAAIRAVPRAKPGTMQLLDKALSEEDAKAVFDRLPPDMLATSKAVKVQGRRLRLLGRPTRIENSGMSAANIFTGRPRKTNRKCAYVLAPGEFIDLAQPVKTVMYASCNPKTSTTLTCQTLELDAECLSSLF